MPNIHPTAVVDPSAKIDPSAAVGPYAVVGPDVVLGARTSIGAHAVVEHAVLGADNVVFPHAHVGTAPQDLKYAGEKTRLVLGDRNTVREGVTLNRGTAAHGETRIGSGCLFMACSHVAHDCTVGNGVIVANCTALAGHVEVGDFSVFGGFVGIHQYVRIGRYCMLGAGSMVGKDVLSFCNAQGDRATLRGLNLVGMRRAGLSRDSIRAVKDAYQALFLSDRPWEDALRELESSPAAEVQDMLRFIAGAKRGVTRPSPAAARKEEEEFAL